jgi:hypothetical protein
MKEKVYFSRRGSRSRPRPWAPRPRTQNSGPYNWCLDRRTDDITISEEHIFQKCTLIDKIQFYLLGFDHLKKIQSMFFPVMRVGMVQFSTDCIRFFKYRVKIKDNTSTDYHAKFQADQRPFR